MKTLQFKFSDQIALFEAYLDSYLKNKSRDCILYSEDGSKFKVHKEIFGQTDFLRKILSSTNEHCCANIEVLCPCSREELYHLVNFLYDGEIHCGEESDSLKIIENLQKIFGFQRNLDMNYPNETVSTSVNNIEAMTIKEEVFENILDESNAEKIVIIPLRSKDVIGNPVETDQGKEDNGLLDNGEKKVSEVKIKPSKKVICKKCDAPFGGKQHLEYHMNRVHLNVKPYACSFCENAFFTKNILKTHLKRSHEEDEK